MTRTASVDQTMTPELHAKRGGHTRSRGVAREQGSRRPCHKRFLTATQRTSLYRPRGACCVAWDKEGGVAAFSPGVTPQTLYKSFAKRAHPRGNADAQRNDATDPVDTLRVSSPPRRARVVDGCREAACSRGSPPSTAPTAFTSADTPYKPVKDTQNDEHRRRGAQACGGVQHVCCRVRLKARRL
jgi:hypothetical protein